jgi:hypothetical protein
MDQAFQSKPNYGCFLNSKFVSIAFKQNSFQRAVQFLKTPLKAGCPVALKLLSQEFWNWSKLCEKMRRGCVSVARFFLQQLTKMGKNIPFGHKIYQNGEKYTIWP